MLDFSNTQIAFGSKSDSDLRLAYYLFSAINNNALVKVLDSTSKFALSVGLPLGWAVRPTLYKQFVGGETLESSTKCVDELFKYGITSILDYSAESAGSLQDINDTYNEIIKSVENAKGNITLSYAVFKPTALTSEAILEKVSLDFELTDNEKIEFNGFKQRVFNICNRAYECGVRVLIDAEEFCVQKAIDDVTEEMMQQFNREKAIVFTTLQMYRHDRMDYLRSLYTQAYDMNYILGVKFVRGAYMEKERERAAKMEYPSPICDTKELTDINFNNGIRFTIEHIDRIETFCGTHNEESNILLTQLLEKYGISRKDSRVFFVQLFGMSDNISYNLSHEGYNVSKYIPYAPVDKVLPYLMRRAQENSSMKGQTSRELGYIEKEMSRRNIKPIL